MGTWEHGKDRKRLGKKIHTASTRSKEDLPAFCRPIIVTSISVALQGRNPVLAGHSSAGTGRGGGVLDLPRAKMNTPGAG